MPGERLSCAGRVVNGGWVTIQLRSGDNESAHLPHPLEDFLQFSYRKISWNRCNLRQSFPQEAGSMNTEPIANHCPKCQAPLPANAPQGLCAKCLLAAVSTPTEAGQPADRQPAPAIAAVAAAFPHSNSSAKAEWVRQPASQYTGTIPHASDTASVSVSTEPAWNRKGLPLLLACVIVWIPAGLYGSALAVPSPLRRWCSASSCPDLTCHGGTG